MILFENVAHKQGFREFQAARRTIQGYEAIHMIRKGQVRWVAGDDPLRQIQFIDNLFDLAALAYVGAQAITCLRLKVATLPPPPGAAGIR